MMCYHDKSFCKDKDCKKFNECKDAFTDYHKAAAIRWMGEDAPVAFYGNRLDCFEEVK
jgi:hypothetical protein